MLFIETPVFTKQIKRLMPDEEYKNLQEALLMRPEVGKLIPNSGGLRKIRWRVQGSGKRSGLRIIYYWETIENTFFMLAVYKKNAIEDLTQAQLKTLRNLVKEWLE